MELKKNNIHGSLLMYSNPYYYQYFTVEVLTGGSFAIYTPLPELPTVYYSLNNNSWTEWEYDATMGDDGLLKSLNLSAGDRLRIKSAISNPVENTYYFAESSNTITYNVSGNIMSLVYGDDFVGNDNLNDTITSDGYTPFISMFSDDTKIRSAVNLCLPSFILSPSMYRGMFSYSTLETAPTIIPAMICEHCYYEMFYNCEYLTGNIVIPEPIGLSDIINNAYYHMFTDSPNINVDCLASMNKEIIPNALIDIGISKGRFVLPWDGLTYSNVDGEFKAELKRFEDQSFEVSDTRITKMFKFSPDVLGETLSLTNNDILLGTLYAGVNYYSYPDTISLIEPLKYFKEQPLTFEAIDNCEFIWESSDDHTAYANYFYKSPDKLKYSINGGPWINYTGGVIVPKGSKISWRSSEAISIEQDETDPDILIYTYFKINTNGDCKDEAGNSYGRFNVSGNIMSLFSDSFEDLDTINGCIGNLQISSDNEGFDRPGIFDRCHIISARNLVLPAINLSDYCYAGMFHLSSLQEPPAILPVKNPRNVIGCYSHMFDGCTNLQTGPIIMVASTYDFSENEELGQKTVSTILTNGFNVNRSYLSDDTWISVSYNYSYNRCGNLFDYMFRGTSIVNAPDIHVCFINPASGGYAGAGWVGMFSECEQLNSLNIYTHSDSGSYPSYNYLTNFIYMVTSRTLRDDDDEPILDDNGNEIIYPKIYCYDGFNKQSNGSYKCSDLWLSAMSPDAGGFSSSNIVNLYGTISIPEPDTTEYFYITVKDPSNTSNDIGTIKIAKEYSNQTWRQLSNTGYIDLKVNGSINSYPITYQYVSNSNILYAVKIKNIYSVADYGGIYDGYIYNVNNMKVDSSDTILTGSTYYVKP